MASKEAAASLLSEKFEDDDENGPLEPWQKAWLAKHRDKLILRVPTMDVVKRLLQRHATDPMMDIFLRTYVSVEGLTGVERARLLLDFVVSQTQKTFWDFQEALQVQESCKDLAVRREDVQELVERFSVTELSAAAAPCRPKKEATAHCQGDNEAAFIHC